MGSINTSLSISKHLRSDNKNKITIYKYSYVKSLYKVVGLQETYFSAERLL